MGNKGKTKKKCCEKYLKTGKHCKSCPLLISGETGKKKKPNAEKKEKMKKAKKKKEKK